MEQLRKKKDQNVALNVLFSNNSHENNIKAKQAYISKRNLERKRKKSNLIDDFEWRKMTLMGCNKTICIALELKFES